VIEVALRDGSRVEIRALNAADKTALASAFGRLSEQSRYRRFLSPIPELTPRQLAYFTEVDARAPARERDRLVMNDERMKALMDPAGEIADHKRMIYGGFEVIVDL
jgi:hypothetical protein